MAGVKTLLIERLEAGMSDAEAMNENIPTPRQVPMITQEMLANYRRYQQLDRERKTLRHRLMDLHERGAVVVDGKLTLRVNSAEHRPCTLANLRRILGEAETEELRSHIEPTVVRQLLIRTRPDSNAAQCDCEMPD